MRDKLTADLVVEARQTLGEALRRMRDRPTNLPPSTDDDPDFSGDLQGLFRVGYASGVPGQNVRVRVDGATTFETRGFSLSIGVDPEVRHTGHEVAPELLEFLGIDAPQTIVKQQDGPGENWYTEFIQAWIIFYQTLGDTLTPDPEEPGIPLRPEREIVDVVIPRWTPIFFLDFKVPETAKVGDRIRLDIDQTYGQRLDSAGPIKQIDAPTMYFTDREVAKSGVEPPPERRVSGWIDVVEPIG